MTVILIPFFVSSCASLSKSVPFLAKKDETSSANSNNATETPVQEKTQPTQETNQEDAYSLETDKENKNAEPNEHAEKDVVDTYIADEMNFEIKKVKAELKHAKTEIRELKAKSEIWTNPLSIYNKEIILNNGSTIFGKIVYQDKDILKAETLIGYLTIDRNTIVRIVENVSETPPEKIEQQIIQNAGIDTRGTSGIDFLSNKEGKDGANVILLGNVNEFKDKSGNTILTGEVKNIGNRRGDFAKINFIFRKDWKGETETLTAFVQGTNHTFDTGIVTDSSVLPGATAPFELIVPQAFGLFIGYSYSLDWEEF